MSCSLVGEMRRRPSSDRVMERYHGIFTGESRSQSLTSTQLEVRSTPRRLSLVGRTAEAVPCAQSVCCSSRDSRYLDIFIYPFLSFRKWRLDCPLFNWRCLCWNGIVY